MTHQMNQQRAALRPTLNMTFFDDDNDDESMIENSSKYTGNMATEDDSSSMARSMASSVDIHTRSTTLALAEFLASTTPEDFAKPSLGIQKKQQQRRASRLLNKFRKRPSISQLTDEASVSSKGSSARHIPLPIYHPPSLRDSGVYSEYSADKDIQYASLPHTPASQRAKRQQQQDEEFIFSSFSKPPPLPTAAEPSATAAPVVPIKSTARPRRPSPLPEAVASAAIAAASKQYIEQNHPHPLRSIPAAALNRRSIVRARHIQQQEDTNAGKKASAPATQVGVNTCPHCRQRVTAPTGEQPQDLQQWQRRLSCPPAINSGELLIAANQDKLLRKKIMLLEAQLAEERDTRIKLEKAMRQKKTAAEKIEQVKEERRRWKDSQVCMEGPVALLPQ